MARQPAIDPKYHDEIIEKYKTGLHSMSELATPYGVTKQAIDTVLKRNNIKTVKKRMFNDEQEKQIIESYKSGKSLAAVANKFNCHPVSITKVLEKHKIPRQDYRIIDFSDSDIEQIKTLYSTGKTTYELAELFNCEASTIARRLSDNGIELRKGQFERQVTKEDEKEVIKFYQSGLTSKQAGKKIGFSSAVTLDILERHNIERRTSRNFTNSEEIEIGKLYQHGFSARQIMRAYGFDHHISIVAAIKRQGIKIRSNHDANRLYSVDYEFFDVIDTEEKAYILGFAYADGCVHKRSLSIALKRSDRIMLEKFKALMESEHPITDNLVGAGKTDKKYKQSNIFITHKHLAKRLKELGIVTGRGEVNKCVSQIPDQLIHHWLRGLIDGDGSWHTQPGMSVCGEKSLLEFVRSSFAENIGTNPDIKIHKHKSAKLHYLVYGGRPQCLRIADWLYQDATIWLGRKKEVWQNWPIPPQ